jgi:hypothetical protein
MTGSEIIAQDLRRRISDVRQRIRKSEILHGASRTGIAVIAGLMSALVLEGVFRFGPGLRTLLFWLLAAGSTGCLLWFVGRPALRLAGIISSEPDREIAALIGPKIPSLSDRIVNGLELLEERDRGFYSPALVDAALEDLHTALVPVDLAGVVSFAASRRLSRFAGLLAGVAVLLALIFPDPFAGSIHRLWHHTEAFASPPLFRFLVEPGDREVIKGETVRLTVRADGASPPSITLTHRREGEGAEEERILERQPDGTFRHEFPELKTSTIYAVRAGNVASPAYRLTVVDRPVVRVLRVQLRPPAYTGLPMRQLEDNIGDIFGLKGTRANLTMETNKPLAAGSLVLSDSTTLPLQLHGTKATAEFTLRRDHTYHLFLRDSQGIANADPIEYAVKVQADAGPTVAIVVPGTNLDVTEKTQIPMLIKIGDDYGVSRLSLVYRLTQSRYGSPDDQPRRLAIPLPAGRTTEALVPFTWTLRNLNLVPDDVVEYYAEVHDNDLVSGPKAAVSERFLLRYPSMEEILADADREHDAATQALDRAIKEAQEARRTLEELRQDMKKEQRKIEWQDQKKAEELVKKYDELRQSMEEVAKTVDRMKEQLQKNQLLSPETLEKYQELQQALQEMSSPELAEALKRLQDAMQQLNPDLMKQALQQFSFSEESFRKSIERTLNLLKRIQIEQKLDEMVKRAEAMAERQEELRRETEAKQNPEQLAGQQEDLSRKAEELQRALQDLQKRMEEFPGEMPLQEMQQARKDLEEGNLEDQLREIAEQLKQHQTEPALQGQTQARQKMERLAQQMQQTKKGMQQNQQRQILNALRQVLQDLLVVSKRQEALKNATQSLEPQSAQFRQQAQEQMEALQDLSGVIDRIQRLSNKTFSISPEMGKSLGEAMQRMNESLQSLDQRNGANAAQQQQAAMAAVNEAAFQVQNAVNAMMQSGGQGMGMAGFLQRLQQMSGRQQGINQQTQGLTPQQAAEMARLAGEQGAVRKSLEQLAREATASGQLSKLLGDLRSVAEEMREVQTDLAQGEVNPETVRKQERILSRLLDSQRSTRERDFENRRKAESGTNVLRPGPGPLDLSTQEGKSRLRRDLLRALEEGYAREYEELIRKYFEILER